MNHTINHEGKTYKATTYQCKEYYWHLYELEQATQVGNKWSIKNHTNAINDLLECCKGDKVLKIHSLDL